MQVIISARGMTVSRTYTDELTRKLATLLPMLSLAVDRALVSLRRQVRETTKRRPRRSTRP